MKLKIVPLLLAVSLILLLPCTAVSDESRAAEAGGMKPMATNLAVLWTSGDPDVAHRVAFLYTLTAKKQQWFDEVTLIVWGPSQRLLAADQSIQAYVKRMQEAGVKVEACIACADSYGIVDQIESLGIPVEPMGKPLTHYLKDPAWEVITF